MTESTKNPGFIGKILNLPNDDPKKTIIVAALLCLVCSILVSISAVTFKPQQLANKATDIKKNILGVTGLLTEQGDIDTLFQQFEVKIVDLDTGTYADIDAATYDQYKAAGDPDQSVELTAEQDIASIGRRAKLAKIYLLKPRKWFYLFMVMVCGLPYMVLSHLMVTLILLADCNFMLMQKHRA